MKTDWKRQRRVQPEILDELPADDPEAIHSRGDLRRLNWLMGNRRHLVGAMRAVISRQTAVRVVELGAGDGDLIGGLLRNLGEQVPPGELILVDRQPCVAQGTLGRLEESGWTTRVEEADVFEWLDAFEADGLPTFVLANLFLHHFPDEDLERLLAGVARIAEGFAACEPRRSRLAHRAASLIGLMGCNRVTRHDARVSVEAGFHETEISHLWPEAGWSAIERAAGLFGHLFFARKADDAGGAAGGEGDRQ